MEVPIDWRNKVFVLFFRCVVRKVLSYKIRDSMGQSSKNSEGFWSVKRVCTFDEIFAEGHNCVYYFEN